MRTLIIFLLTFNTFANERSVSDYLKLMGADVLTRAVFYPLELHNMNKNTLGPDYKFKFSNLKRNPLFLITSGSFGLPLNVFLFSNIKSNLGDSWYSTPLSSFGSSISTALIENPMLVTRQDVFTNQAKGPFESFRKRNWNSYYRGVAPILLRNSTGTLVYFSMLEALNNEGDSSAITCGKAFCSSVLATSAAQPFEALRAAQASQKGEIGKSLIAVSREVFNQGVKEGMKKLYCGLPSALLSVPIRTSIVAPFLKPLLFPNKEKGVAEVVVLQGDNYL